MMRRMAALAAVGMLLGSGVASAAPRTRSRVSAFDRAFVMKAAQGGMAEVRLGRMATRKGASDDVKQFGRHMVQDHSKANQELMQIARQKGIMLPRDIGPKHRAVVSRLTPLSGPRFDRRYMADMVKDHEEDVAAFRRASRVARDPGVRAFAARILPTLEMHLQMARDTATNVGARVGGSGGMNGHGARMGGRPGM